MESNDKESAKRFFSRIIGMYDDMRRRNGNW